MQLYNSQDNTTLAPNTPVG